MDAAVSQFRFFERMRDCLCRLANRARLGNAFAHALASLLIDQILNEMSNLHRRTADHDPKCEVDFQRNDHHRALLFRLFLSGVVEIGCQIERLEAAAGARPSPVPLLAQFNDDACSASDTVQRQRA